MISPRIHATPSAATAERVREIVIVCGREFIIERPAGLDKVFDHPAVRAAYASDEYIPYWTDLWASARMLAKAVLREPWHALADDVSHLHVLELGCGLGLAGVAALACGMHVTFSDCDEAATQFAANNARLNGFDRFDTLPIDLRSPPANLRFPVIIGSDVMYEERLVQPLAEVIRGMLAPGGLALIADPDRLAAKSFHWHLHNAGLAVEASFIRAGEPGGERVKGTLHRIRHAAT